jgi:hypothetical protein
MTKESEEIKDAFGVRRSAFGVRRSAFGVRRSVFGVRCSVFGVRRSASRRDWMIVARKIYCLVRRPNTAVPLGYGVMGFEERGGATMASPVAHLGIPVATIIPSRRDGSVFNAIPGNKLPGYDHSVPPGRKFTHSPHRRFAHTLHPRLHLRFVLFLYLRRHQLRVGPIRRGLVLEDAMVQIFAVTGSQRLGLD